MLWQRAMEPGAYLAHLHQQTEALHEQGLFKRERIIEGPQGAVIRVQGGREVLNLCANNYLGLADHPRILKAAREGLDQTQTGSREGCRLSDSDLARQARLWAQKWRWYERSSLPWNRARIHWEFMRREAYVRWPVHGNVLEALREGRLEVGAGTLLEPHVWITAPGRAREILGTGAG